MKSQLLVTIILLLSLIINQGQQPPAESSPSPGTTATPQKQVSPADADQDVVRITANLVQIDAVVTKDGKQVTDLKAEDFEVFEDGKRQTITQFSYVSNVPEAAAAVPSKPKPGGPGNRNTSPTVPAKLSANDVGRTIALVLDDLGMSTESVPLVKKQVRKFINEQLGPNDLVAILNTGGSEVGALQQFTSDRRLLNSAVDHLRYNQCSREGRYMLMPIGSLGGDLYPLCGRSASVRTRQVLRFILKGMRDLPGRKSLVLFSDSLPIEEQETALFGSTDAGAASDQGIGDQTSPMTNPSSMIEAYGKIAELAIRASVVIYAVDSRGLVPTGITAQDQFPSVPVSGRAAQITNVLRSRSRMLSMKRDGADLIAKQTGGFMVYNSNDFGLKRVLDDQRGYYLIGYRPNEDTFTRRFHHIKVEAKGKGLTVRTRKGFYGIAEEDVPAPVLTVGDRMNKALMSPFGVTDIKLRLTTIFADDPVRGALLRSFLLFDPRDLTFTTLPDGTHEAQFDLRTVTFGDYGRIVAGEDENIRLPLSAERYKQVLREGIVYAFDRPLKQSGAFQFRVALHDKTSSRIGSAGQFVEVPNLRSNRLALSGLLIGGAGRADNQLSGGPAVRQFKPASAISVVYVIYNAVVDKDSHLPQLRTQARIYRDGQEVYAGKVEQLVVAGQSDLKRIAAVTQVEPGAVLSPGEYVLQIEVEDLLAKPKQNVVAQWIDFTVEK